MVSGSAERSYLVEADGLRFQVLEWGAEHAEPLLLVHGFTSSTLGTWSEVVEPLAVGRRVIGVDFRGHGGSDWDPAADYTLARYTADTENVLAAIGVEPRFVIGHSLGGRASVLLSDRHPGMVDRLVLVDTRMRGGRRTPDVLAEHPERFADRETAHAFATARLGSRSERIEREHVVEPDGSVRWQYDLAGIRRSRTVADELIQSGQWNEFERLGRTLVFRGKRSRAMLDADVEKMRAGNPNVTVLEIPDAGHLLHQDQPERFLTEVERFFTS